MPQSLNPADTSRTLKIAVVGAGAAGITAAHLLSKKHDVTLFEASGTLGGHAHAEALYDPQGREFAVDTAFLIFNTATYPNFLRLVQELGAGSHVAPAEMSSCFEDPASGFSYTLGAGWTPFLAQPSVLLKKEFHQVLRGLRRFRRQAGLELDQKTDHSGITAGEYLKAFDPAFVQHFVWPLTSAIWSLADGQMQNYPIAALIDYFDNHQLIRGRSERRWRTFQGSSRVYVQAFQKLFRGRIRLKSPVHAIERKGETVHLQSGAGVEIFDQVVLATHADTSLKMIAGPTADEARLLGAWIYKDNPVTLHRDAGVLHRNPRMWGSWNMRRFGERYQISYYLNRLQSLPLAEPVVLTLGPAEVRTDLVVKKFNYRHPVFDLTSVASQRDLPRLNGPTPLHFCGSYFGHGFHEDAVRSAADVARRFGCGFGP